MSSDLRARNDGAWREFRQAFDRLATVVVGLDEHLLIDLDVMAPSNVHRSLQRLLIRRGQQLAA